jgi:hypothetical protein
MADRRDFIKTSTMLLAGAGLIRYDKAFAAPATPTGFFGVHPFIEQHPEAVFIMRTNVDYKTNSAACREVGFNLGRSVLVPMDKKGIPVTSNIAAKPNITDHSAIDEKRGFTLEDTMGITTDSFFVEGMFESLKELGVAGQKLQIRDINGSRVIEPRGYKAMGQRTGATVLAGKTEIQTVADAKDESSFVWKDVPDGVMFSKIPYLWPFNAQDSWNLNLAKFKAHTMGVTLTMKNWQGSNASPFQGYCQKWQNIERIEKVGEAINMGLINPKARSIIEENLQRHRKTIPRWNTPDYPRDSPGYIRLYGYDVLCMETWAHRTIDNLSASPMGLCVVEGIYGRDGDFNTGPNPFGSENNKDPWLNAPSKEGRAWDYMTNIVIFGKNPYLVDIIGHYLGGHEPGNFGIFHIAMERGKLNLMNPINIPLYEWSEGFAVRRPLTSFTRTPLRTSYIQQVDSEPLWHLCDQPFDYNTVSEQKQPVPVKPASRVLNQDYPASFYKQLAIEIGIPTKGWVYVEILDKNGKNLEVIMNAICDKGYHMATWNTGKYTAGSYQYRVRFNDFSEIHDIVLNRV